MQKIWWQFPKTGDKIGRALEKINTLLNSLKGSIHHLDIISFWHNHDTIRTTCKVVQQEDETDNQDIKIRFIYMYSHVCYK